MKRSDTQWAQYCSFANHIPKTLAAITPDEAKQLASMASLQGAGQVAPNPLVGAVIVNSSNHFLGCGWHQAFGQAHAEINALEDAKKRLGSAFAQQIKGARIFVTLEPCSHHGKTPPCIDALIKAGIGEVIAAMADPNPKVDSRKQAKAAGLSLTFDSHWAEQEVLTLGSFLTAQLFDRSHFALKVASSMDGCFAVGHGQNLSITGQVARQHGRFLRQLYDGILIGQETALVDQPSLTTRLDMDQARNPVRLILDPDLKAMAASKENLAPLWHCQDARTIWLVEDSAAAQKGALVTEMLDRGGELWRFPKPNISAHEISQKCLEANISSVLLEGGAKVYETFIVADFVDSWHIFLADRFLRNQGGRPWFPDQGSITELSCRRISHAGDDAVVEGVSKHLWERVQ